ncbi:alpha/beta fold hydrolase [Streptomyces sp. SAJ15]|uniref:alpha/beta fold hydrolase n=1 Tax=Streptomyces sp. SAJ15 TaxID=2011095 RepID=UPI0021B46E80|nr:alpha/beta hydrolase [Streptomyces sp. SAJ15]
MIVGPTQPVELRRMRPAAAGRPPLRVLMLHGLASGASVWEPFAERAPEECELWAAELPWRGSGVPGWAECPAADWIEQAVAAVPGGPQVVLAHSFGAGALLAWLDRARPAAAGLRGVVLVSPFYRAEAGDFSWETISYYLNDFYRILDDGLRVSSAGRVGPEVRHGMALKVQDRIGPYGWVRFFDTYLGTPRLRTDRMRMPFLIVGGEKDFAAFPADSEALGAALPAAEVTILPGAGHFSMVEQADEFAAAAHDFLHSVSVRPRPGDPGTSMEHT